MIAIDMEMPKSCKRCQFLHSYVTMSGNVRKICGVDDMPILGDIEGKSAHCPLIDMDKYQDDGK